MTDALESAWADFLAGRKGRRDAAVAGGNATAALAERDQHLCQIITVMVRCAFPGGALTANPPLVNRAAAGSDCQRSLNDLFAARDLAASIAATAPDNPALADIAANMGQAVDPLRADCHSDHLERHGLPRLPWTAPAPTGWMIPL